MPQLSLYFCVSCDRTSLGESVYIVGNIAQLGGWETGLKLATNADSFPEWKNQDPVLVDQETTL